MKRPQPIALLMAAALMSPACSCDPTPTPDGGTPTAEPDPGPDVGPSGNGLQVSNADVRSCQVLFTTNGAEVPNVEFADEVTGEFIPKAPRFALAFAAKDDASLVGVELARFVFEGDTVAPSLTSATCFDASGAEVTGAISLVD